MATQSSDVRTLCNVKQSTRVKKEKEGSNEKRPTLFYARTHYSQLRFATIIYYLRSILTWRRRCHSIKLPTTTCQFSRPIFSVFFSLLLLLSPSITSRKIFSRISDNRETCCMRLFSLCLSVSIR